MQDKNEFVSSQLNSALNQLRNDLDNAFGEVDAQKKEPVKEEKIIPVEELRLRQRLKLTEYLLSIKESQLADEEHLRKSVLILASALALSHEGLLSVEQMMKDFSYVIHSSGLVLWSQLGGKYSVSTANISVDEGEKIFREVFSRLDKDDINEARININNTHYLIFTESQKISSDEKTSSPMVWALLFSRDNKKFSEEYMELGRLLSRVVFNAAALVDL